MLKKISDRFDHILKSIRHADILTENNIKEVLKEIRYALIEADVPLSVLDRFLEETQKRALGQEVLDNLNPGQMFLSIIYEQLTELMGGSESPINLKARPPAVIMLLGLQGSGKTTTAAKLARYLMKHKKKSVLLASMDVYRPAAIEQLEILAKSIDCPVLESESQDTSKRAKEALNQAEKAFADILIVDTAGRSDLDETLMAEIKSLRNILKPIEIFMVADAMLGQRSAEIALAFHQALSITGSILTKVDGDARGGAALSLAMITGQSVKFSGIGEKIDDFEVFHPDRIAARILGRGDLQSLMDQVDTQKNRQLIRNISVGKRFTLLDFKAQIEQVNSMGGIENLLSQLPSHMVPSNVAEQIKGAQAMKKFLFIIDSMTKKERLNPDLIELSRKNRISKGSGTEISDVNVLLKQFKQSQKMMKKMKGKKMNKMMQGFSGGAGGLNQPFSNNGRPV